MMLRHRAHVDGWRFRFVPFFLSSHPPLCRRVGSLVAKQNNNRARGPICRLVSMSEAGQNICLRIQLMSAPALISQSKLSSSPDCATIPWYPPRSRDIGSCKGDGNVLPPRQACLERERRSSDESCRLSGRRAHS